jgi:hypothetical protein
MVENVQFVNVSELTCIRMTCPSCKSTIEANLGGAGLAFKDGKCAVCQVIVCFPETIAVLANALEVLTNVANSKNSQIGFALKKTISES